MKVRAKVNRLYLKKGNEYDVFRQEENCYYIQWNGVLACVGLDEVEVVDEKAYDLRKRCRVSEPVVAEIMRYLGCLKPTAKLRICGSDDVYFHISQDGSIVNIDCSPLDEEYLVDKLTQESTAVKEPAKLSLDTYDVGEIYKAIFGCNPRMMI